MGEIYSHQLESIAFLTASVLPILLKIENPAL